MSRHYPVIHISEKTTAQEIVNAVAAHLAEQGHACTEAGPRTPCANRNDLGDACAVACLLSDKVAEQFTSWNNAYTSIKEKLAPELMRFDQLLASLQAAHDGAQTAEDLTERFDSICRHFGLIPPPAFIEWTP